MADAHARVPMSSITKNITMNVEVTGVRTHAVRLWLAGWLLWLAARVAGVGFTISTPETAVDLRTYPPQKPGE